MATKNDWQFEYFVFLDVETTGLVLEHDKLLEVAGVATNSDLEELGRIQFPIRWLREELDEPAPENHPAHVVRVSTGGYATPGRSAGDPFPIYGFDPRRVWRSDNHKIMQAHLDSGLLANCWSLPKWKRSRDKYPTGSHAVALEDVEDALGGWIYNRILRPAGRDLSARVTLAGCTPWWDWVVLRKYAPHTMQSIFYYRPLDASGLKAAVLNWAGLEFYPEEKKVQAHRALPDALYALERTRKLRDFLREAGSALRERQLVRPVA